MEEMTLIDVSMKIILHAGDARLKIEDALKEAKAFNFAKASELLASAHEYITLAHKEQTEIIQGEAQGQKHDLSILFIHAQDTLMTIMSELNLSKEIVASLQVLDERLRKAGI
ncbi:MAG: PTS lactose/cellobiose transporter subunit IIA [Erysipelotrichaceae bacterium]|nr:PTS lactose/cellobiose transporter subunit IIA [Erysipelotrichaceae bacterium]